MAKKSKARKRGDSSHTIAKRYKLRKSAIKAIDKAAYDHGSIGRAIQTATELLVRRPKPLPVADVEPGDIIGKTYKLVPRTIRLIERLSSIYGTRGGVLAAAAQLLTDME